MRRSRRAKNPPRAVRIARRIRKFPTFSAMNPAKGGVKMKRMGMTALMIATSLMDRPNDFMCRFRYGYSTDVWIQIDKTS